MKKTTNIILPDDYPVRMNKVKTTLNSFKRCDTIDEFKIKAAIKVLEAVVKNKEDEVSKLHKTTLLIKTFINYKTYKLWQLSTN